MTQPAAIQPVPTTPSNAATETLAAATQIAPPDAVAAQTASKGKTAYERAQALKSELEVSGDEPASASEAAPSSPKPAPASGADSAAAPADDATTRARAERLERIQRMQAKEQAAYAEKQAQRERVQKQQAQSTEIETLRKKLSELEPLQQVFSSEDALLAEAEKKGLTAEKLVAWMRKRLTDPAAIAQQQAKSEADKIREELAAERKAREDLERRLADRDAQHQAQFTAQQKAMHFLEKTSGSEASHPLTARFLAKHGQQAYINYANQIVAPMLPEEYSVDELHDHFEQLLDELQLGAAGANTATATPANGASRPSPKKNGAAEPATTLSNALTAERASVAEEKPLNRLPLKERERLLREQLARE